ncbi:hypothetical protein BS78_02G197800 [Paspalum vaginatum]|nr:hypothetical protein BS78_02G197800 [Paspalum vaginatum]
MRMPVMEAAPARPRPARGMPSRRSRPRSRTWRSRLRARTATASPARAPRRRPRGATTRTTTAAAAPSGAPTPAPPPTASTTRTVAPGATAASPPRLRGGGAALSSGDATPSMSVRTDFPAGDDEEDDEMASEGGGGKEEDAKEWVAQVEPGVLITFVSLAQGGNDLKRIRFSREMFNKWQAQRWWAENYDKVMELYNVQRFNQTVPLPTTPKSEDESSKEDSPVTPPLDKERLPRTFHRAGGAMGYSSSDSLEHHSNRYCNGHHHPHHGHQCCDSMGLASTPKLSSISGAKTETSSMDASMRTSSSPEEVDRSGELSVSISNASDQEREWVEEDEPGVYITIRALPGGIRELRRVRFSREKFSEMHARLWWEENRARIHEQYL